MQALLEREEVEELVCEHHHTEIEEATVDYYDPSNFYGHGQYTFKVLVCSDCGEQLDQEPFGGWND